MAPAAIHETLREYKQVQPVELEQVVMAPDQFLTSQLKFRCMFVELGNLFDTLHIAMRPERDYNLVVWDDHARVWEPEVRGNPMVGLYVPKDQKQVTKQLADLKKYQMIEVVGRVISITDGKPQIEITKLHVIEDAGAFSDASVYHVQQGNTLANDGVRDLADEHFADALKEDLPVYAKVQVRELRSRQLVASGH